MFAMNLDDSVTVIDGATNNTTTVTSGAVPYDSTSPTAQHRRKSYNE